MSEPVPPAFQAVEAGWVPPIDAPVLYALNVEGCILWHLLLCTRPPESLQREQQESKPGVVFLPHPAVQHSSRADTGTESCAFQNRRCTFWHRDVCGEEPDAIIRVDTVPQMEQHVLCLPAHTLLQPAFTHPCMLPEDCNGIDWSGPRAQATSTDEGTHLHQLIQKQHMNLSIGTGSEHRQ